jgi:hypothetical protein
MCTSGGPRDGYQVVTGLLEPLGKVAGVHVQPPAVGFYLHLGTPPKLRHRRAFKLPQEQLHHQLVIDLVGTPAFYPSVVIFAKLFSHPLGEDLLVNHPSG